MADARLICGSGTALRPAVIDGIITSPMAQPRAASHSRMVVSLVVRSSCPNCQVVSASSGRPVRITTRAPTLSTNRPTSGMATVIGSTWLIRIKPDSAAPRPRKFCRNSGSTSMPPNMPTVSTKLTSAASVKIGILKSRRSSRGCSSVSSTQTQAASATVRTSPPSSPERRRRRRHRDGVNMRRVGCRSQGGHRQRLGRYQSWRRRR